MITPDNPSRSATARVTNPLPRPEACPHCAGPVQLVRNREIYSRDYGEWPWAFLCRPCDAYVGLHPFTAIPLGTLATPEIREARKRAKTAFNPLWQSGAMTRGEAYRWLASTLGIPTGECHVGWFSAEQCEAAIAAIHARGNHP